MHSVAMDHLAIMNPKWHLIEKILSGEKTIESRWYVHKIAPWGKISVGDIIYFKDAGKQVTAKATVSEIVQKELSSIQDGIGLVKKYQSGLCFTEASLQDFSWLEKKKYAVLIFLENPTEIEPFGIDKHGFGCSCAWITVNNIKQIKLPN